MPFAPGDGGYASVYVAWTAALLIAEIGAVYWMLTLLRGSLRGSEGAEAEIRRVAIEFLRIMQREAPNLFSDYTISKLPDGREVATTPNEKV